MIPENLIVKYLSNEATEEEIDILYQWLASDSKNQEILSEYIKIHEQRYENELTFNSNRGLSKLRTKMNPAKKARVINMVLVTRVAAAFIVLTLSVASYYVYEQLAGVETIETIIKTNPYGQKSTFQLPDGSIVKLNAGSSLEFDEVFGSGARVVKLQGEAFFEVVKDKDRPFRVVSNEVTTTVLGTSFNVKSARKSISVSVATGKVQVADSLGNEVFLTPGDMGVYTNNKLVRREADLEKVLAWKDNSLVFDKASLREVGKTLEQWYGVKVDLSQLEATDCLFNGKFKNENLMNVLEAIAFSTGIEYKKEDKNIILSGNGCK